MQALRNRDMKHRTQPTEPIARTVTGGSNE